MTRDAIADELFPLLNEEPQSKGGVVYVLGQIRKMLEHDGKPENYWAVKFFCDWVAHTQLAGPGARSVLKILDDRLPTFDFRNPEGVDPNGMVFDILSFGLLRRHLLTFFGANDLPTRWVEDEFTWTTVVRFYGEQVLNTPLLIDRARFALNNIRKVEIVGFEPVRDIVEANPDHRYYGFEWLVTLNDSRTFRWPFTSNVPEKPANWVTQGTRKMKS